MKNNFRKDNRRRLEKTPTNCYRPRREKEALRTYDGAHKPRGDKQHFIRLAIADYYDEEYVYD